MNRKSIQRGLYLLAVLMIVAGAVLRIGHLAHHNFDLHLILAGHLLVLTAIFIHIKYVTEAERAQEPARNHIRQLNSK